MIKNKKLPLSVTLSTFNEEAILGKCLEAIKDIASEIVIFDGMSTDKTVEVARKYGAKITLTTNKPNFHINKKMANDQAKSKWVLQLDADEVVTSQLKEEIRKLLTGSYFGYDSWQSPLKAMIGRVLPLFHKPNKLSAPASAYYLVRKNFFLNRYLMNTGQYPDPVIRLFQKGKAFLPAKDVHEQMEVVGQIGWLKGELDHYATPNFSRYLTRENRYSSLLADELYKRKVKITVFNTINYLFIKPALTFFRLYVRYRGFLDGFPGFVFSIYSGFHYAFGYMKLWELYREEDSK